MSLVERVTAPAPSEAVQTAKGACMKLQQVLVCSKESPGSQRAQCPACQLHTLRKPLSMSRLQDGAQVCITERPQLADQCSQAYLQGRHKGAVMGARAHGQHGSSTWGLSGLSLPHGHQHLPGLVSSLEMHPALQPALPRASPHPSPSWPQPSMAPEDTLTENQLLSQAAPPVDSHS